MKKRRSQLTGPQGKAKESDRQQRELETLTYVNELLAKKDIVRLRQVAAIRGLVNDRLRRRVWPVLLGIEGETFDDKAYKARSQLPHKDSQVVLCDMARSLWVGPVSEADREKKRQALQRIIEATVGGNDAGVHYYQGLHDIASVLLLVSESEALASRMLSQLAVCHLKDCTRPSLDATTEVLSMLYPILREADPELHAFLAALGAPALEEPHWALSWYMTWFAHEVQDLSQIARLFDFFIASHPLMPLYAAAVAVRAHRESILACGAEEGGDAVYATLRRLSVLGPGSLSADELAQQAAALYQRLRPHMLLRQWGLALKHATTLDAYLHEGRWKVPEFPPKRRKQGMQRFKRGHQSPRLRPPAPPLLPPPQQQQAAVVVALFTGLAGFAFLLAQMQALGIVPPAIP